MWIDRLLLSEELETAMESSKVVVPYEVHKELFSKCRDQQILLRKRSDHPLEDLDNVHYTID